MNNEKAIKIIQELTRGLNENGYVKEANDLAIKALEKQVPFRLADQDSDTGICKCGRVTEIIDGEFFCKYCGQKLTK